MQPVVAPDKIKARQDFGRLFNAELDRIGAPPLLGRGRPAWLYKKLIRKRMPLVSREQCRKYVKGIDIPDQGNLWLICERLELDWKKLQPAAAHDSRDPLVAELERLGPVLAKAGVIKEIVEFARFKLGEKNTPPNSPEPSQPSA